MRIVLAVHGNLRDATLAAREAVLLHDEIECGGDLLFDDFGGQVHAVTHHHHETGNYFGGGIRMKCRQETLLKIPI